MKPLQGEKSIYNSSLCTKKRNGLHIAKTFLQQATTGAMCCHLEVEGDTNPLSLVSSISLAKWAKPILALCPSHVLLLARKGLVNEVKFLRLITQNVAKTNEIMRSVIITSTLLRTEKFVHFHSSIYIYIYIYFFFSGVSTKWLQHCSVTVHCCKSM